MLAINQLQGNRETLTHSGIESRMERPSWQWHRSDRLV